MGFLDDLIKTVQEAAEEAKRQQRKQQQPAPPEWSAPETDRPVEAKSARIVRRRREDTPAAELPAPAPPAHAKPQRPAPAHAHAPVMTPAERLRRLMRQPGTLREIVVLKELLDRPLALRRGRFARRGFGAR